MTRRWFIGISALIGAAVGSFALFGPGALMLGKGVVPNAAAAIWVREVGAMILALSAMGFFMRNEPDSRALRAFLVGNALVHVGLFPIEIAAYRDGAIERLAGIVPNSVLHVLLAGGFAYFALTMEQTKARRSVDEHEAR